MSNLPHILKQFSSKRGVVGIIGLGGHCIPIDPFYLTAKARSYDIATRFIELAGEINTAMPSFVVQRTAEALNAHGKAMKGANYPNQADRRDKVWQA